MSTRYDAAVAELYQAPHGAFTAERKRIAGDLKAHDKAAAAKLAKLPRPTISAWVVNQLWWHARDAFDDLLDTAARLRDGDLGASGAHRDAIAKLRSRASAILSDAGHGATESTLRRVTTTLSALAATGGFAPDPPGALAADRDPPGFEAVGIVPSKPDGHAKPHHAAAKPHRAADDKHARQAEERRAQAEAAAERRRAEQAEAARKAQRHRLEAALRTARGEVDRRKRDLERLRDAITEAERAIDKAQETADDLEAKLAELD